MIKTLKKYYNQAQFCNISTWGGVFLSIINPFYLSRSNLRKAVLLYAPELKGDILDFGCGSKPYQHSFTNCTKYIGCDIEVSGHCHSNENIDYYYDGKVLPFTNNSFDNIFSSEVFEHIFNLEEIVKALHRVLKSNGKILLTVPFVWNEHEVPFDCARYTSFGISNLLEKNGFEVLKVYKSTTYIETLAQMLCEYLRKTFARLTSNGYINLVFQVLIIAPVTIMGIVLNKILPYDDSWYSTNIVLCRKNKK